MRHVLVTIFLLFFIAGFVRADQTEGKVAETVISEKQEIASPGTSISLIKPKEVVSPELGTGSEWPFVLLSLIAIIGLILGLAWLAKRFGGLNAMGMRDMKVVSAIPVGAREKVALLDVGGTQILIGITSQNINHLHTFETAVIDTAANEKSSGDTSKKQSGYTLKKQSDYSPKKQSDFALKLQSLIGDKRESKHAEP